MEEFFGAAVRAETFGYALPETVPDRPAMPMEFVSDLMSIALARAIATQSNAVAPRRDRP